MYFFTILLIYLYFYIDYTNTKSEPFTSIYDSIEAFNVDFFKAVSYYNIYDNLVCSPTSAHIILSMATYGSNGKTYNELQKALHLPKEKKLAFLGFHDLTKDLHNNKKSVELKIVNRIYTANGFHILSDYKKLISTYFFSGVRHIDVMNPHKSAETINHWVKKNTEISNIINPSEIHQKTRMVLLSAMHFKGTWKHTFLKKLTENRVFHVFDNFAVYVPTMYNYEEYFIGDLEDLEATFIELPYKDSDLSMIIILPHKVDGLKDIINNFSSFNISRLSQSGFKKKTFVYLPKFKIERSIQLTQPLHKIGIHEMFFKKANFSGISDNTLLVNKIIQKTFIDVNEEGTEAAASTVSMMVPYSYNSDPATIIINKPFLFQIIDTRTHLTLFVGTVTNPKEH